MKIAFTMFYDARDLGIRYLTTYMRNLGHEVKIIALKKINSQQQDVLVPDKEAVSKCYSNINGKVTEFIYAQNHISDLELDLLRQEIAKFDPDVIGFGTRSRNFVHLDRIIPALKSGKPSAFLVAGGAGPTLDPDFPLKLGVDAIVRGEGEYALEELFSALEEKKDWHGIQNVAYLDKEGKLVKNPMRRPEKNLDKFPFPCLDMEKDLLIDNDKCTPLFLKEEMDPNSFNSNFRYILLGSRGCMGDCSYCGGRYLHEEFKKEGLNLPRVRQRSLGNVLDELVEAKEKTSMRFVQFLDEYFVWPTDKLITFFKNYREKINLPLWMFLSAEQLYSSSELFDSVVKAGLESFPVGLQTADEEFCKKIYNRINHNGHIIDVSKKMLAKGIPVQFMMIMGNPMQDEESLRKNWDFFANFEFDPSFRSNVGLTFTKLYKPAFETKLFQAHPEFKNDAVSNEKFYYDCMLCNLRLVLNDTDFYAIVGDEKYKKMPWELGQVFKNALEKAHAKYLLPEIERIAGKEVYYWGSGNAYQKNKHLFRESSPECILNDYTWEKDSDIDGLKIANPDSIELDTEKPLIIFARHSFVNGIYRKAHDKYGFKDIIVSSEIY